MKGTIHTNTLMALLFSSMLLPQLTYADIFDELEAEAPGENAQVDTHIKAQTEEEEFEAWKKAQEAEFSDWKEKYFAELEKYKKDVLKIWDEAEVSDKKVWVEYSEDLKTKKVVDYEKNEIRISIVEDKSKTEVTKAPSKEAIEKYVSDVVNTTPNEARKKDRVLAAVNADKRISDTINNTPILNEVIETSTKPKTPPKQARKETVKRLAKAATIKVAEPAKKADKAPVTTITIKLPKNSTAKRAEKFARHVHTYAEKNQLDKSLVYAVMHTESAFNPMARSNIPAFGLMQIVPSSAGKDVTQKLEGKARLLDASYLYDAKNNIEAGSTYLNILYYSYLKAIKDPLSRKYCAIAAYNTGAGNVSVAFTGSKRLRNAIPIINAMTPQEVYDTLLIKLPYEETQKYLERVVSRQKIYE